jgi:hypothetical protein
LRAGAWGEEIDQRWRDNELIRDFREVVEREHLMTADNLAYTLLIAATRHRHPRHPRHHRDYRSEWLSWTPFGDLEPGSTTDGPASAGH